MNLTRATGLRSPFVATGAAMLGFGLSAGSAPADFIWVYAEEYVGEGWVENGYEGLTTVRLYAEFDRLGNDGVLAVFGAPDVPLGASIGDGWFYNDHAAGTHTPPIDLRSLGYWENQWDTYVTINATDHDGDATSLTPGFAEQTNDLCTDWQSENVAWYVTQFDPQSRADEQGRVLIGQFTYAENALPELRINLLLRNREIVEGYWVVGDCQSCNACTGDVTSDGTVDMSDLLAVLSAWGDCNGCREDHDCSATVDFDDLEVVLEAWGDCGRRAASRMYHGFQRDAPLRVIDQRRSSGVMIATETGAATTHAAVDANGPSAVDCAQDLPPRRLADRRAPDTRP